MFESGTYEHWMVNGVNKVVDNSNALWREKYIYYSLSYNRLIGVYYLFCIGIFISIIALIVEFSKKYYVKFKNYLIYGTITQFAPDLSEKFSHLDFS